MQIAKGICYLVLAVMGYHFFTAIAATGIHTGLGTDVFFAGYKIDIWQAGIDADLMMGLVLICGWIFWRERSWVGGLIWINVALYWGNIIVAFYLLRALNSSGGKWDNVMLGSHVADKNECTYTPWPLAVRVLFYLIALALGIYVAQACAAVNYSFVPTMGYVGGLGCWIPVLLRIAYVGKRQA